MLMNEADSVRQSLKGIIKEIIAEETNNCIRLYKAVVVSAPNGTTIGVQIVGEQTTLTIPYSSAVRNATVGESVWVMRVYGASNSIAWLTYDFDFEN